MTLVLVVALIACGCTAGDRSAIEQRVAALQRENSELRRALSEARRTEAATMPLEAENAEVRPSPAGDTRQHEEQDAALSAALHGSRGAIDVRVSRILVLPAGDLFEGESIELSNAGRALVERIAPHLPRGRRLLVTGHRGPRPFGEDEYPEIHRATVVARRLHALDSRLSLSAASLADHMPRSPAELPVGQTPSDRIEIYLQE